MRPNGQKKVDFMVMEFNSNLYYYDDEGNIYPNRTEAIKSKKPCKFYYYDKEFAQKDWSKVSDLPLQELYRQRAQQIRDQYDHVVICYSGGIDSTQVLESFYYNNIHIDEILVVGALSQDSYKGSDENHNGELYKNVFPTLNSMHLPKTKISVTDYTQWFNDPNNFTLLKEYGPHYYEHIGIRTSLHNLFWYDLDSLLNHKKKTAYVFGKDKPVFGFDELLNKWYTNFVDISFADYGNRYDFSYGKRVNFYTEPDAIDIMLKQYQICIENYITHGADNFYVNDLVYDVKNPLVYKSRKSSSLFLSARDVYIGKHKGTEIYNLYAQMLSKITKEQSMNFNDRKIFVSKRHYIDRV